MIGDVFRKPRIVPAALIAAGVLVLSGAVPCGGADRAGLFSNSASSGEKAVVDVPAVPAADDPASIEARRKTIHEGIAALQEQLQALPPDHPSVGELTGKIEIQQRINSALAQWLSVLQELRETEEEVRKQEAALAELRRSGPNEQAVSFVDYDTAADRLRLEEERLRQTEDRYQLALREAEQARKTLREKEGAYRRQKETVDAALGRPDEAFETGQLALAELDRDLAAIVASQRGAELNLEKANRLLLGMQIEALRITQGRATGRVRFTEADLAERLAALDDLEKRLREELVDTEAGLRLADMRLQDLLLAAPSDPPTPEDQAHIDAARQERRFRQRQATVITMRLQRAAQARLLWERRFRLFSGDADPDEKNAWAKAARETQDQIAREARLQLARLSEMREENRRLDEAVEKAEPDSELQRWLQRRQDWLIRQIRLGEDNLGAIDRTHRLAQKLVSEAEGESSGEKLGALGNRVRAVLHTAWNFELAAIDERPVTVRKIVIAFLVFILGLRLSRWFSRRMVASLLDRTRADPSGSAAVQSMVFYMLVVFFAVTALYLANIPLGLFALLGGALAIGLGFGSQNIINNFISGLILMLERPIRVGDMVEVEGTYGLILRIGARCTQVQTGNNIDLMVPNSVFLESNVINWTLSDDRFRCNVSVGVAYGSPTRNVEDLLQQAVLATARVQSHPAPIVIFRDFGDNALLFEVHFWIRMKSQMDRLSVESAVRFEIDDRFREAGITISFPQRDVHLDTLSPLDVRVVGDGQTRDPSGPSVDPTSSGRT